MFFDNAKRFEKVEEVKRPYTDAVDVLKNDHIGSRNTAIKIVDGWKQSQSPDVFINQQQQSLRTTSSSPPPLHTEPSRDSPPPLELSRIETNKSNFTSPRPTTFQSSTSSRHSFLGSANPHSVAPRSARLTFIIHDAPGPDAYNYERSTLNVKGSLSFAPTTVQKRKMNKALPLPGPGAYYQPSDMVIPSFNAHVNKKVRKKVIENPEASEEEVEVIKKHPIIIRMEAAIATEPRSTAKERKEVRRNMKNILTSLR